MKTCYNTIDIVFNILKKKKKKKQWSTRDRIDLPSRSTSVPFRIPFNSYLANIDDPSSGWSTRATAYRCTQCNRPHTHARTKGYPHGRMSRARKCSTLHGMHFCDCYQTLGRCSSVWNVDSYPEPYILYTHALFLSLSLVLLPFFSSHKRFVLRSWSRSRVKATIGEILSRSFLRILDSPGHRATKNSCLSIRGPKNVRPAAALGFVEARNKMEFVVCTRDYVHGKIFVFLRVAWNMAYILKYFPATCVIFWDSGVLVGRQWIPFEQISLVCRAHWKKFRVNTIERKFLFRRGIPPDPSGIFLHRFTPITTIFNTR